MSLDVSGSTASRAGMLAVHHAVDLRYREQLGLGTSGQEYSFQTFAADNRLTFDFVSRRRRYGLRSAWRLGRRGRWGAARRRRSGGAPTSASAQGTKLTFKKSSTFLLIWSQKGPIGRPSLDMAALNNSLFTTKRSGSPVTVQDHGNFVTEDPDCGFRT